MSSKRELSSSLAELDFYGELLPAGKFRSGLLYDVRFQDAESCVKVSSICWCQYRPIRKSALQITIRLDEVGKAKRAALWSKRRLKWPAIKLNFSLPWHLSQVFQHSIDFLPTQNGTRSPPRPTFHQVQLGSNAWARLASECSPSCGT